MSGGLRSACQPILTIAEEACRSNVPAGAQTIRLGVEHNRAGAKLAKTRAKRVDLTTTALRIRSRHGLGRDPMSHQFIPRMAAMMESNVDAPTPLVLLHGQLWRDGQRALAKCN